ncbi:hypothetical protein A3E20_03945 [Candidatus Saccharibacteria bacterium RIFCSPHIGHO2_12_FULL_47_16]|nr:MAG: hypothetical protein A3E20_03945 [Candidatus Saccharibacteria bacterium RIFCSPHIGHO2_12_FULL_47_16]
MVATRIMVRVALSRAMPRSDKNPSLSAATEVDAVADPLSVKSSSVPDLAQRVMAAARRIAIRAKAAASLTGHLHSPSKRGVKVALSIFEL